MALAAFPWYDLTEVQWANDALWRATGLPGALDRSTPPLQQWQSPDLCVSQACGLDLFLADADIQPVAAPVFDLNCTPGCYFSYVIGDPGGRIAAVNALSSRSGWSALLTAARPPQVWVSGSHVASLEAVRSGRADMAAIDAVTWLLLARHRPTALRDVTIVATTPEALAPPYVVRAGGATGEIFAALSRALLSPATADARRALLLKSLVPVTKSDYQPMMEEHTALCRNLEHA